MTDTQRIVELAARAKVAYRNGDDIEGDRLTAEAVRISDLATLRRAGLEPDEHDYIHSDEFTDAVVRRLRGSDRASR